VAWIVVVTLLQIRALTHGPAEYGESSRTGCGVRFCWR